MRVHTVADPSTTLIMKTTPVQYDVVAAKLRFANMDTRSLRSTEAMLMAVGCGLFALALWGPSEDLPAHYHAFADRRAWQSLPNALDVLSNLGFAIFGVLGLLRLWAAGRAVVWSAQRQMVVLFFLGLALTALCSGIYHWQPDDAGLKLDRVGMAMAFAGLLGLLAADRVSDRAGQALALLVLLAGPVAASIALTSQNQLPWVVVQFGGLAIMVWLSFLKPMPGALPVRWLDVILIYALAKLLELGDLAVYEWTGQLVSGHSLKHLVASFAAWPVLTALPRLPMPCLPDDSKVHRAPAGAR